MGKLVQCVLNFSEGRRVQEIGGIVAAIKGVPGLRYWTAPGTKATTALW